jgi:hypothetical protein
MRVNERADNVTVDEFEVADPADAWVQAGFSVDSDAVCRVGGVRIRLAGRGRGTGIVGWSLRGLPSHGSLDDLRRTVESLTTVGVEPRRERDGQLGGRSMRQVFFRAGEVIIEVVGSPDTASDGPSTLWGITYVVADIDATAAYFGDRTAPVKDAVQPGRRITTLRHHELGISVRSAMISAHIRDC